MLSVKIHSDFSKDIVKRNKNAAEIQFIDNILVMSLKEKQTCSDINMVKYRCYKTICKTTSPYKYVIFILANGYGHFKNVRKLDIN